MWTTPWVTVMSGSMTAAPVPSPSTIRVVLSRYIQTRLLLSPVELGNGTVAPNIWNSFCGLATRASSEATRWSMKWRPNNFLPGEV